jgi:hypothetical protein
LFVFLAPGEGLHRIFMGDKQEVGSSEPIAFGPHPRWAVALTEEHRREVERHSFEVVYGPNSLRSSGFRESGFSEEEATSFRFSGRWLSQGFSAFYDR